MKQEGKYSLIGNYSYVYGLLWEKSRKIIVFGVLEVFFTVLVSLIGIAIPSVIIYLVESGTTMNKLTKILIYLFVIVGLVYGIQAYLKERNNMQYISFVYGKSTKDYMSKCFHIKYDVLEKAETRVNQQKALNALTENFTGLEGFLRHNVHFATSLLGLSVYILFATKVSIWIVALLLFISVVQKLVYDKAKKYELKNRSKKSKLNIVQEYLRREAYDVGAGKDIRLFRLSDWLNEIFEEKNLAFLSLLKKERRYFYLYDMTGLILQLIRDGVCYGYLLFQLSKGMNVSMFVFYLGIIGGYGTWFSRISDSIAQIGRDHLMLCDLRKFLDIQGSLDEPSGKLLKNSEQIEIVFDHVTFCYDNSENKILDDVSFRFEGGKKYALVGINGAGKTTIVKLICGFYKPTEGNIYINGINSKEINLKEYWREIAVVFQEAFLHSFTIAENISGEEFEKTDLEKCYQVLEKAGLKDKVDGLEKGLKTAMNKDISPDGVHFSGGEVQKLMLARALYKEAYLLILDEPTAALDAIAEHDVYQRYQILVAQKTALFISHRLASTRFCDCIFFLSGGKIVETGTHEELLDKGGMYAEMFYVQSKYYQEGEF